MVSSMAMLEGNLVLLTACTLATSLWLDWPLASSAILLLMLGLFVKAIPLNLAWDESRFGQLLRLFLLYWVLVIGIYAVHLHRSDLSSAGEPMSRAMDAIYVSISTWTTLGASDLVVPKHLRLAISLEALIGTLSMALTVALIWLWCEETLMRSRKYVAHLDALKELRTKEGSSQ